jgi:hypothetical protein
VTRFRRTARGLTALALVAPLSGAALLLAAAPASAATGITAPGDGTPYDRDANIHIAASIDKNSGSADLKVKPPNGTAQTVDSASTTLTAGASLAYDFDTATCASFPRACSGRAQAVNGRWTVTLEGGGKVLDTATFIIRIAPRAPQNVAARADGYRAVVVSWSKGVEPDLTGWTLYADGGPSGNVGTDACNGSSCSTTVTYAQDGTGSHTYSLVAHRRAAPDSSDVLDSPQSGQASATLGSPPPPPPSPQPSPSSNGGGTTSGAPSGGSGGASPASSPGSGSSGAPSSGSSNPGSGGSSTGTTPAGSGGASGKPAIGTSTAPATVASRRAFALSFRAFAPKLGIPKLPPLPDAQPAVAPLPFGTYQKTLGYKDVVKTEKVSTPQAAVRRVTSVVGSALDSDQFLRSIAGALVLLLVAAHLRRWLGSAHDAD